MTLIGTLDDMCTSAATVLLVLSVLTTSCGRLSPVTAGLWIGDVKRPDGADRLEVVIDSSGATAQVSLAAWQLDSIRVSRILSTKDSLEFTAVVRQDTVRLRGAVDNGRWEGSLSHGHRHAPFEVRRLHNLSDAEQHSMVGTYRTDDGRLLGIAPFSEFGARPMIVDYGTGRIGPLYPVSREQLLVGRALIAPVLPPDSLELSITGDGKVKGIRFAQKGQPVTVATRVETRDEEVRFTSGPITLGGTLILPAGPPPYPALVLVHGSNALTRDVFGPWSRFFAGQGFAVLSYDKRGTGASTGNWKQADFPVLAGDVLAGVRFLTARSDIRADRVGLWGASQGGWILPIVAAEAPREIAFLVVHAGSGTTVREEGVLYVQYELRAAGLPESSVAVGTRYQQLDDRVTASGTGWPELQRFYEEHRKEEAWLWPPRSADDWFRPYYRMLMDFDPSPYWKRVTCPVLLFFGELDVNVPLTESWPPLEQALRVAGNTRVTRVLLPKANHVFLEARSGGRDEYPGLSRFVPGYFDRMASWLVTQAR